MNDLYPMRVFRPWLGRILRSENVLILLLFAATNGLSYYYQPPTTLNEGKGTDGIVYYEMAAQFSMRQPIAAWAPFVYRIGTPFLVSRLSPNDLIFGFKLANLAANSIAVLLLAVWLRKWIASPRIRVLLVFAFMLQWHGPIRLVYYYPTYIDPGWFAFLLGGLITLEHVRRHPTLLRLLGACLLFLIGTFFRETMAVLAVAALFVNNPLRPTLSSDDYISLRFWRRLVPPPAYAWLILAASLSGLLLTHLLATKTNEYSFFDTGFYWLYQKPILTYVHGWFVTFGPLLALALFGWKTAIAYLMRNQYLLVYALLISVLAWLGGSDTERILNWAMPVVFSVIGVVWQANDRLLSRSYLAVLFLLQLLAQRAFWVYPDAPNDFVSPWPFLSVLSNHAQVADLWSYHGYANGNRWIGTIALVQYLFVTLGLVWWLKYRQMVQSR